MRIGIGYDIHRLEAGRPLVLGGVQIQHEKGLVGHSDADALCHAVTDALLGALSLGDIGTHFPDTSPEYEGADSTQLLANVVKVVHASGYRIVNVDTNIIAQRPKLMQHISAIRSRLAEILEVELNQISVKAKTNERVDAVGREEAISTQAVVLLTAVTGD